MLLSKYKRRNSTRRDGAKIDEGERGLINDNGRVHWSHISSPRIVVPPARDYHQSLGLTVKSKCYCEDAIKVIILKEKCEISKS